MKTQDPKKVYADASSLILLYKAGLLELFSREVRIILAMAVFKEITREGYDGALYFRECQEFTIRTPAGPWPGVTADTTMGPGEAQTLALYYGEPCRSFILIDDGRAARFCKKQGLPFINALLVPKVLYYSGKLDEQACQEQMTSLAGLGWYSTRILDLAFQMSREDLGLFLSEETP